MIYLTSENFAKFYYAKPFSFASILCLIIGISAIVMPALIAYTISGVGLRRLVFTEQPTIVFRDEVVVYNFENSAVLGFSSYPNYISNQGITPIVSPTIKSIAVDSNHDGKIDSFRIKIGFTSDSQNLQMSQIYLFFSYQLQDTVNLEIQDFIKLEFNAVNGFQKAKAIGRIELNQKDLLSSSSVISSQSNQTLFDEPNENLNLYDLEIAKQQKDAYISCNCESVILPAWGTGLVEIDIELIVPEKQIIYYKTNTLESLKFSWIEFLSIFIPIYIILDFIMNLFFRNRLISVQVVDNIRK